MIVRKGANYGYSLREGTQLMSLAGMGPLPEDDTIPLRITDTVVRGTVKPTYPVIQYPHAKGVGGDAIAGGFVYRGSKIPALKDKLVFGDITTGRIWYAQMADVLAADDGNPATLAPIYEMGAAGSGQPLRELVEATFHARGGVGTTLPGGAAVSGPGRVDLRFAADNAGNIYIMTKSDGMIRQVVGAELTDSSTLSRSGPPPSSGSKIDAVASMPRSLAAGKSAYDFNCASCHGNAAQGAAKAGLPISIIQEQGGRQPPDLTDDAWDHGSTDSEIYAVIKKGVPLTMMTGYDGRISDQDIWNIVAYIRSLAPKK
jgi:mono/diheme cytochrome c family protein